MRDWNGKRLKKPGYACENFGFKVPPVVGDIVEVPPIQNIRTKETRATSQVRIILLPQNKSKQKRPKDSKENSLEYCLKTDVLGRSKRYSACSKDQP